jgi:hypothetical protein
MKKISNFFTNHLAFLIVTGIAILCLLFTILGKPTESGYITLNGQDAKIEEYTEKFIENANDALYRIMNEDKPTDDETIKANEEVEGLGGSTTLNTVLSRRLPDGNNDNGRGWQCSKYTAYLATGKREYSNTHPDYGPVNGKDVANWLVKNYGWKYIETPVEGAIGSGGFNTKYGHTAMYLYSTGANTAMVNDANYIRLTVATHNMDISGWVWVVPDDYIPIPEPDPSPPLEPETEPQPISGCSSWHLSYGDTLSKIMLTCKGYVNWSEMNEYARHWYSSYYRPEQSVLSGWNSYTGIGLYAGDTIYYKE